MEAVDNLTSMAEMESFEPKQPAVIGREKLKEAKWIKSQKEKQVLDTVKNTFRTVHNYLKHVYTKEKKHLNDVEMQKGIQAIMMLADEAAEKVDSYSPLFKKILGHASVKELKEYQDLQDFYLSKLLKRFKEALDVEQAWQEEWGTGEEDLLDIHRRGLKDLETVKRDKDYELFYIRKEDGSPFFNKNLVRHIKLVTDFDEVISDVEGEDPLLRINLIKDRNANFRAQEIKQAILSYLDIFLTQALKRKHEYLTVLLTKSVMALFLAANPRNLRQYTTSKNCLKYFYDFISYLRQALTTEDYLSLLQQPPSDEYSKNIIKLIHAICFSFYTHRELKVDAIDFIEMLIGEKEKKKKKSKKEMPLAFWNRILDSHEAISKKLKKYPNGPLLKTIDILYEQSGGYDPIKEENFPYRQFDVSYPGGRVISLKIPSPTTQETIDKAAVLEEFKGFLRHDQKIMEGASHYLIINMQDRTSWKESARCSCLEELQRNAEFIKQLTVVTLPKDTDFYLQAGIYENETEAELFLMNIKDQIRSGEESGFFFPKSIRGKKIEDFTAKCLPLIHEVFFSSKKDLDRKERLDFIEIFYSFLFLKLIEWTKPTLFSFMCKDAVDTSAVASTQLYAMIHLLKDPKQMEEVEKEFIFWLLFSPSLLVRERITDLQRLHRMISAVSIFNAALDNNRALILQTFSPLFEENFFASLDSDIL
ncbi:MAG: hypothetical protein Tsb0015_11410 [Simkaniaceae bacterium]